ncbi:hypothetical protein [Paenibacillus gansuensis]|uniref:Uncharacterized protein n=1 Tax=Paenibacillus gansuensis TaxID=306542 RepID=A0ABW5PK00_9BACL
MNEYRTDGRISDSAYLTDYQLASQKGEPIEIWQSTLAPYEQMFGFGVHIDDFEKIQDGIRLKRNGLYLYEYKRNKRT